MTQTMVQRFIAARRAGTPLIGITTFDPAACMGEIQSGLNKEVPIVQWDIVQGWKHRNELGRLAMIEAMSGLGSPEMVQNPTECLERAKLFPDGTILFMLNGHHHIRNDKPKPDVIQALWNLRDVLKAKKCSVVLLGPIFQLPSELQHDILILDERLPDESALHSIIETMATDLSVSLPKPVIRKAVDALRGLAAFPAEQAVAMSWSQNSGGKVTLDVDSLWERKRQLINDTPGLSVWMGGQKFNDLGGLNEIKERFTRILNGRKPPQVIVWIDEIEKAMSGSSGGDSSGTSQDQLGVLLSEMQDKEYSGSIFVGVPGAAKSAFAKAVANEADILTIKLDLGDMKGQFVGLSEERIRQAMKIIEAVGGHGGAFFIATSNDIRAVKPELKRRFKKGIWFFDLPDKQERALIWDIFIKKFPDVKGSIPNDEGWTGAEIESCVLTAWEEKVTLIEAAKGIIPVSVSGRAEVEVLRHEAENKYSSARYPGAYTRDQVLWPETLPQTPSRKLDLNS